MKPPIHRLIAIAVACALLFGVACDGSTDAPEAPPPVPGADDPQHGRWRVKVGTARLPRGIKVKTPKSAEEAGKAAAAVARRLYDAAFLAPDQLVKHAKAMRPPARSTFVRAKVGAPPRSRDVLLRKRSARVTLEPGKASKAAALVSILATGETRGRKFRVRHRGLLWMEKAEGRWRIVGFDVMQAPAPKKKAKKEAQNKKDTKKQKKQDDRKSGKQKRSDRDGKKRDKKKGNR